MPRVTARRSRWEVARELRNKIIERRRVHEASAYGPSTFMTNTALPARSKVTAQLAIEGGEEHLVGAEDLRAHAVGDDLAALLAVQSLDEVLDGRDVVRRSTDTS